MRVPQSCLFGASAAGRSRLIDYDLLSHWEIRYLWIRTPYEGMPFSVIHPLIDTGGGRGIPEIATQLEALAIQAEPAIRCPTSVSRLRNASQVGGSQQSE